MGGNATEFFEHERDDNQSKSDSTEIPSHYRCFNDWRFKDPKLHKKLQQAINDHNHNYAFWDAWQYTCETTQEAKAFSARHAELLFRRRNHIISLLNEGN